MTFQDLRQNVTTLTPIGHPNLRLQDIHPSKSPAYSQNLHRWMRQRGHAYRSGGVADTVYRVLPGNKLATMYGAGTLFIGHPYSQYEDDTDFSGAPLIGVLCHGAKAGSSCLPGAIHSLEEIKGFWDRYLQVGRCAIDPEHKQHFIGGNSFVIKGDLRECLWCGVHHRIITQSVMTPKTVTTYEQI